MQKQIHLVLGSRDVGQLLDGLEIRQQSWQNTTTFLETGESPAEFFLAEECSDAHEAQSITETYARIIETIRRQKTAQSRPEKNPDRKNPSKEKVEPAFAIYINTFCSGPVPVERDENNLPVAYATEHGAQIEIADLAIIRLQQFLAVERDFEDATTVEEYAVPVDLHPDGSITDENGKHFPDPLW